MCDGAIPHRVNRVINYPQRKVGNYISDVATLPGGSQLCAEEVSRAANQVSLG